MNNKDIIKAIDKIAWWIPFRKKRDELRNKLINLIIEKEKYYENKILNSIDKFTELTNEIKDINKQKETLKNNLKLIEIETHSYFNRKCWFCPNSIIDRKSENIELDENIYLKIIYNLKEIDYSNNINFHRFNEPLSQKELIIKRIKQARFNLPKAIIGIFTNGDYLTKEYLDELKDAGVNSIIMSYYFDKNEKFDKQRIVNNGMNKILDKLKLSAKEIIIDNENQLQFKLDYEGIDIFYRATDFSKIGNNRGMTIAGVNSVYDRTFRCFFPFTDLYIDYNGYCMPCCHLRSDIESHKNFILGNIYDSNLFEIFTNQKTSELRKYLCVNSKKISPCSECEAETEYRFINLVN